MGAIEEAKHFLKDMEKAGDDVMKLRALLPRLLEVESFHIFKYNSF